MFGRWSSFFFDFRVHAGPWEGNTATYYLYQTDLLFCAVASLTTKRLTWQPLNCKVHSPPAIPDGQNPKNLSGAMSDPGQQARLRCKEIQNLSSFIRDSKVSGLSRSRIVGGECTTSKHLA